MAMTQEPKCVCSAPALGYHACYVHNPALRDTNEQGGNKKPGRADKVYKVKIGFKSGNSQEFTVKEKDFIVSQHHGALAQLVFTPVGVVRPQFLDWTTIESIWILGESQEGA